MRHWDFDSEKAMLSLLVGQDFGSNPEIKTAEIHATKAKIAVEIKSQLNLKPEAIVVEIGSGIGIMAKSMAADIGHLFCCDISQDFIKIAQSECRDLKNVSFTQISNGKLAAIPDRSVDAIFYYNVFIHLNIYDIFMYFREFNRIAKTGSRVWIDFINIAVLKKNISDQFRENQKLYEENPQNYPLLLNFNYREAIIAIAKNFGFKQHARGWALRIYRYLNRDNQRYFIFIKE